MLLSQTEEKLKYTPEIAKATDFAYDKVSKVIPRIEWPFYAPYIYKINKLKKEKNAVILAHNYQTPEIFHCVADIVGDSLALADEAAKTKAEIIILCGVHFMAETAKLLNPNKKVLIPDLRAGCSLASSITGKDVRLLKEKYPNTPVVTYVNTSAEVKAETDVCCTSANAVKVIESMNSDKVIFLPDEYLAKNTATQTNVKIISWKGKCEVHEKFTAHDMKNYKKNNEKIIILAHPECPPEVIQEAHFSGSTSAMINYVKEKKPSHVLMVTECSMSDNIAVENPEVNFIRPCNLCPHMKRITLPKILKSLENNIHEITIDKEISLKARRAVERMMEIGR
jgi:quinolinate synthase